MKEIKTLFLFTLISVKVYCQNIRTISSSDTTYVETMAEGKGSVFLKKNPIEPGKYVVVFDTTDRVLIRFQISKNGELCGYMTKYGLYSGKVVSKVNYGKCYNSVKNANPK